MLNKSDKKISRKFYTVPKNVSTVEAIIYDWVAENYGETEAESGSWCIPELAENVKLKLLELFRNGKEYQQKFTVHYEKEGD